MKKMLKILLIIVLVTVAGITVFLGKALYDANLQKEDQQNMIKSDEELIGEHFYMPRIGKESVDMNLYLIRDGEDHPLVINIHGGAFIAGDADTLDSQSDRISKDWDTNVATVNYKLMSGDYDKQYAVDEIKDTVRYFIEHAEEYHIDTDNIFVMGYSAGGYHAMASALQLHKEGIHVKGQIICYGFLSDMMEQFESLSQEQKESLPAALFVLAGDEPIGKGSLDYESALKEHGVSTEVRIYDGAMHGFIEENNPEYYKLHSHSSMSAEQEIMAKDAEAVIGTWISEH